MYDKSSLEAYLSHGLCDRQHHFLGIDTPYGVSWLRRICQRPGHIEDCAESDLRQDPAKGGRMNLGAHAVEDANAGTLNASFHQISVTLHIDPESFQNIDAAAF